MTIKEKHDRINYIMECLNRRRVEGRKLELVKSGSGWDLEEECGVGSSGRSDVDCCMTLDELYYFVEGMIAQVYAQEQHKTCPNPND